MASTDQHGYGRQGHVRRGDNVTVSGSWTFSGAVTFSGSATVSGTFTYSGTNTFNGNVNIGDNAADTLTVTATATFNNDVVIGSSSADTLTVNSTSTIKAPITIQPVAASTATTEAEAIDFDSKTTTLTVTDNVTDQRFYRFQAPVTSVAATKAITNASTVYIEGAPSNGGAGSITNAYALFVDAGAVRIDGAATFNDAVTLGDAAADVITVNGTVTFNNATVTIDQDSTADHDGLTLTGASIDAMAINLAGSYQVTALGGADYAWIGTTGGADLILSGGDDATAATAGGVLTLFTKAAAGGNGVNLQSQAYSDTTNTKEVQIFTGNQTGASGNSGNNDAWTGNSTNGLTGQVTHTTGNAGGGASGDIIDTTGTGTTATGTITHVTGNASAGNSGDIENTTGTATGIRGQFAVNARTITATLDSAASIPLEGGSIDVVRVENTDIATGATDTFVFDFVPSKIVINWRGYAEHDTSNEAGTSQGTAVVTITGTNTATVAMMATHQNNNNGTPRWEKTAGDTTNVSIVKAGSNAVNQGSITSALTSWNTSAKRLVITHTVANTANANTTIAWEAVAYL